MRAIIEDKFRKRPRKNLKELFIFSYLLIAFGAYFLSLVLSRIERIKALFGL